MDWSYSGDTGPENWYRMYSAACGGKQSPIDIKHECAKRLHSSEKLKWLYNPDKFTITNTGHGWRLYNENNKCEISGGPLNSKYELKEIHAHWGATNKEGSEHTVNGKKYAAELHLLHWNKTKYASYEEATKHPDGLCVFAVLLKLGDKNCEIEKIVEQLPNISHKGNCTKLATPLDPRFLLPQHYYYYWAYRGSITIPPCFECVVWIVFQEALHISPEQLQTFRNLRCHSQEKCDSSATCCSDHLIQNCRPLQPLGDRIILYHEMKTRRKLHKETNKNNTST